MPKPRLFSAQHPARTAIRPARIAAAILALASWLCNANPSAAAGAPYRIVVATPAGKPPAAGYPVIYVIDGNAWTGLVSEIIRNNVD